MKRKYPLKNILFLIGMFVAIAVFWYFFGYFAAGVQKSNLTQKVKRTETVIYVRNLKEAKQFYSKLPGFRFRDEKIFLGNTTLAVDTANGNSGVFYLYLPNELSYRRQIRKSGLNIMQDKDGYYFEDPDGNKFYIKPDQG